MIDLDDKTTIAKLDKKNVYGSLRMLPDQSQYVWELSKVVRFPDIYKSAENIILCGMGGSRYGAYIVQNLYRNQLKVPFSGYGDYHLPAFVNKKSLFILSSYSGDTEEPLNSAQEAIRKNIPIVGLTGGGKAAEMSKTYNFPSILFDQKYNPSGQPRLGTGYMVFGTIALLARLGYLSVSNEEIMTSINELKQNSNDIENQAKQIAKALFASIPVFFAAEFLNGNTHVMRNQFNETAKSFSAFSELPELNHHLMEGLKNPADKKLKVMFIDSDFYSEKLKKRFSLTKDVVEQNGIPQITYKPKGSTMLSQMLNTLSFGGYASFYLALLYGQDPSVIPWVDYFKNKLAKA